MQAHGMAWRGVAWLGVAWSEVSTEQCGASAAAGRRLLGRCISFASDGGLGVGRGGPRWARGGRLLQRWWGGMRWVGWGHVVWGSVERDEIAVWVG